MQTYRNPRLGYVHAFQFDRQNTSLTILNRLENDFVHYTGKKMQTEEGIRNPFVYLDYYKSMIENEV